MNIPINQIFSIVMLTLLLQASLSSCSGHDEPNLPEVTPQIVFLFSPGGLGDMSYNDCILEGVQHFKKENPGVDLFMYSPDKFEESEKIFTDWVARPASDTPVLFVFASSDYDELVTRELTDITLPPNKRVLVFESRKHFGEGVSSFQICMYGASYLAGVTAAEACGDSEASWYLPTHLTALSPSHVTVSVTASAENARWNISPTTGPDIHQQPWLTGK